MDWINNINLDICIYCRQENTRTSFIQEVKMAKNKPKAGRHKIVKRGKVCGNVSKKYYR